MTNDKTTALIEAFRVEIAAIPMGRECVKERASAYKWGIYYIGRLEALAAFEQLDQYKQQVLGQATVTISRQEYESLRREQPAVREMTLDEVAEIFKKDVSFSQTHTDGYGYTFTIAGFKDAAKALAKLGTIRVVDSANG